ncbi:MAG: endonuclease V, partial [Cyanobacteria bacterium J06649_11]
MDINSARFCAKNVAEAKIIQSQLRGQVISTDRLTKVKYVAGVDIGFEDKYKVTKAAIAILTYPELELVEQAIARIPTTFPYVPGYLAFREIP